MIQTDEAPTAAQTTPEPRWKAAGPPYLLTRAELVAELAARGVQTTDRQIRSWTTYGLLPSPTQGVPPGKEDRRVRALYEPWVIGVAQEIDARLRAGRTIEDIKPSAERIWRNWYHQRAMFFPGDSGVYPAPEMIIPNIIWDSLGPAAIPELADKIKRYGFPVSHVDVIVHLEDGSSYPLALDPSGEIWIT